MINGRKCLNESREREELVAMEDHQMLLATSNGGLSVGGGSVQEGRGKKRGADATIDVAGNGALDVDEAEVCLGGKVVAGRR